jgi:hypothetical protein
VPRHPVEDAGGREPGHEADAGVKNYVSVLFAKLGMQRRTQAAAFAARIFDGQDQVRS